MYERTSLWSDPRDPALEADGCCWPGCDRADWHEEASDIPLCTPHFIKVGDAFAKEMQIRLLSPVSWDSTERAEKSRRRLEARAQAIREQAVVYYVRIHDCIKIGYSTNLKARLSTLRVDDDAVLATEPGGRELEALRHQEFADLRIGRRENFKPVDRLLRHIEHVREVCGEPNITTYPQIAS